MPIEHYSFEAVETLKDKDRAEFDYLNSQPATFVLPAEAVDGLRSAAGEIIAASPEFQRLLKDSGVKVVEAAAEGAAAPAVSTPPKAAGVTFYTDIDAFAGNGVRRQDPLYSVQGHAIYNFNPTRWAALDGSCYTGGRTTVNGVIGDDLQRNSRGGGTLGARVRQRTSPGRTGTAWTSMHCARPGCRALRARSHCWTSANAAGRIGWRSTPG